jgi:hypothetical protein
MKIWHRNGLIGGSMALDIKTCNPDATSTELTAMKSTGSTIEL